MSRGGNFGKGNNRGKFGSNSKRRPSSKSGAPARKPKNVVKQESDEIRLNKFVANSGVCSRREADLYIQTGSVWVNGKPVTEMGYKVKLTDEVKFDGRLITPEKKEYILLNKPKGFITTTSPEKNRTVMELVANASRVKLKPVGRLERNTTGLLLFTNDVDLEKKLTHHNTDVRKIFHVELDRNLKFEDIEKIQNGVKLDEGYIEVEEISYIEGASKKEIGIQLNSTKNNIIHKLFEHFRYDVIKLDRVIFGGLTKKDLPRGHWRKLTEQEVINLKML